MPITLPDISTDAGIMARLLLAESLTPQMGGYDAPAVKSGMQAMRATVDNRLNYHPELFNAKGATSYKDIIVAKGQFQGFTADGSGNVVISSGISSNIDDYLKRANTGQPGVYTIFVQNALDVANDTAIHDPFTNITNIGGVKTKGGAFGWVTAGSADPGGSFVAVPASSGGIIAKNQFYTISI